VGEHYVVDVLAGVAYAAAGLLLVAGWSRWRQRSRAEDVAVPVVS